MTTKPEALRAIAAIFKEHNVEFEAGLDRHMQIEIEIQIGDGFYNVGGIVDASTLENLADQIEEGANND